MHHIEIISHDYQLETRQVKSKVTENSFLIVRMLALAF